MKITKETLKQLIKEELDEGWPPDAAPAMVRNVYINPKAVMKAMHKHRKRIEELELRVKQLIDHAGIGSGEYLTRHHTKPLKLREQYIDDSEQ